MTRFLTRRVGKRSRRLATDSDGFTLVELLVVMVIMPIVIGALTLAIITVLENTVETGSHGTAARLSASHDEQITSAYVVRDIQSAAYVSTSSAQVCGTGNQQLLGLAWYAGNYEVTVSYVVTQTATPAIVRNYCTTTATSVTSMPTAISRISSLSDISDNAFSGVSDSVGVGTCPSTSGAFGNGASSCATDSAGTAYVAVSVNCVNTSSAVASGTCASSGLTSVVPTASGGMSITGAVMNISESAGNGFAYSLRATPRLSNTAACGSSCAQSNPLNPPFVDLGGASLGNCSLVVNGQFVDDDPSVDLTIGSKGFIDGTSTYLTSASPGIWSGDSKVPQPVVTGPPITSPYSLLQEPPTAPVGAGYSVVTITSSNGGYDSKKQTWTPSYSSDPGDFTTTAGGQHVIKRAIYIVPFNLNIAGLNATNGALFYVEAQASGNTSNVSIGSGSTSLTLSSLTPSWESPASSNPSWQAPTPEPVLWIAASDPSPTITLNGTPTADTISGAIYAPGAAVSMSGGGNGGVDTQAAVLNSITCSGGGAARASGDLVVGQPINSGIIETPQSASVTLNRGGTATNSDAVTVTGLGNITPSGTVDFYLCPVSTLPANCTPTPGTKFDSETLAPVSGTASATATSAPTTLTAAGTYCMSAYYEGSASYNASEDTSLQDGCFYVAPYGSPTSKYPPAPTITSPANYSCFSSNTAYAICPTTWPGSVSGTSIDTTGVVSAVSVAFEDPAGMWWNPANNSFSSSTPIAALTTPGAGGSWSSWSYSLPASALSATDTGSYTVIAVTTDSNATGPAGISNFTWDGPGS